MAKLCSWPAPAPAQFGGKFGYPAPRGDNERPLPGNTPYYQSSDIRDRRLALQTCPSLDHRAQSRTTVSGPSTVRVSEPNKCKLAVPAASAKRPCCSLATTLAEKLEKVVSASDPIEHKVKIELVTAIGQLQPIGDQRLGHAKHRVRCKIRVVFAKDMGDQGFVARSLDLEMRMCGRQGCLAVATSNCPTSPSPRL